VELLDDAKMEAAVHGGDWQPAVFPDVVQSWGCAAPPS
jgi:hypothetical protein